MSTVSVSMQQTIPKNPYTTGSCNCFTCESQPTTCLNGDWQYGTQPCCGGLCQSIPLCSHIDSSICPRIASGPSQVSWQTMNSTNPGSAMVTCQYNASNFQNLSDVQNWVTLQGMDSQYQTQIMPAFCSGTATTCPTDWLTNQPMPKCNRLLSTGPDGTLCRQWQQQNPQRADIVMANYCNNPSNIFGCDCLRRQQTPGYNLAAPNFATNDACWYRPCQATTQELVTSDLLNPVCPATTCQNASNITPAQQQIISQNFISCPLPSNPVQSVAQTLGINTSQVARSLGVQPNSPIARSPIARRLGFQQVPVASGWKWVLAAIIIILVVVLIVAIFMNLI